MVIIQTTSAKAVTVTVATFDDPSANASNPLFEVNLTTDLVTAGWDDSQTNLDLDVVYSGNVFNNAFFEMTPVTYTGGLTGGTTGGGTIEFWPDGGDVNDPLIQIDFDSANISLTSFGALDLFIADGVTITGTEIDLPLTDEAFSFGFANQQILPGQDGYTATAAFTCSATVIPEPATIALLAGGLMILARKRSSSR